MQKSKIVIWLFVVVLLFTCAHEATDEQSVAFNIAMILRKDFAIDQLNGDNVKEQLVSYFQLDTIMERDRKEFYINELMKVDSIEKRSTKKGVFLKVRIGTSCFYLSSERATQCEAEEIR